MPTWSAWPSGAVPRLQHAPGRTAPLPPVPSLRTSVVTNSAHRSKGPPVRIAIASSGLGHVAEAWKLGCRPSAPPWPDAILTSPYTRVAARPRLPLSALYHAADAMRADGRITPLAAAPVPLAPAPHVAIWHRTNNIRPEPASPSAEHASRYSARARSGLPCCCSGPSNWVLSAHAPFWAMEPKSPLVFLQKITQSARPRPVAPGQPARQRLEAYLWQPSNYRYRSLPTGSAATPFEQNWEFPRMLWSSWYGSRHQSDLQENWLLDWGVRTISPPPPRPARLVGNSRRPWRGHRGTDSLRCREAGDRVRFLESVSTFAHARAYIELLMCSFWPAALRCWASCSWRQWPRESPWLVHKHPVLQWVAGPGGMSIDRTAPVNWRRPWSNSWQSLGRRGRWDSGRRHCLTDFGEPASWNLNIGVLPSGPGRWTLRNVSTDGIGSFTAQTGAGPPPAWVYRPQGDMPASVPELNNISITTVPLFIAMRSVTWKFSSPPTWRRSRLVHSSMRCSRSGSARAARLRCALCLSADIFPRRYSIISGWITSIWAWTWVWWRSGATGLAGWTNPAPTTRVIWLNFVPPESLFVWQLRRACPRARIVTIDHISKGNGSAQPHEENLAGRLDPGCFAIASTTTWPYRNLSPTALPARNMRPLIASRWFTTALTLPSFRWSDPSGDYIAAVCCMAPKKGYEARLPHSLHLKEQGNDLPCQIVGTGPLLAEHNDLRRRHDLHKVLFLEERHDVPQILSRAMLVVVSSPQLPHSDNFKPYLIISVTIERLGMVASLISASVCCRDAFCIPCWKRRRVRYWMASVDGTCPPVQFLQ